MSIRLQRPLLFRVDPLPRESPRGYLCRVAHEHGYCSPLSLAQIAGLPGIRPGAGQTAIKQLSHVLRLEPEEWRVDVLSPRQGAESIRATIVLRRAVSADDLNYRRPRLCPLAFGSARSGGPSGISGLSSHALSTAAFCSISARPARGEWPGERPAVHKCRCGLDFRDLSSEAADPIWWRSMQQSIAQPGFQLGETAELDLTDCGFPPEMLRLKLGALLRLILFVGSIKEGSTLRRKQRPFARHGSRRRDRDLPRCSHGAARLAPALARSAAAHGPAGGESCRAQLQRDLRKFLSAPVSCPSPQGIRIPSRCLRAVRHRGLEGLHPWPASLLFRCRTAELPMDDCERGGEDGTHSRRADSGSCPSGSNRKCTLERVPGGGRTECWIRRESLNQWIATRDLELARYMPRAGGAAHLGLEEHHRYRGRPRRRHPLRKGSRVQFSDGISSSFVKMS